ncbi:MAG: extracellular solute-binding protein [Defluviitaleaceae bacterium]|nr:extracellular solute-binding protein [Defluviitaleaceae bacterium]
MKKCILFSLLLVLALAIGLTACGNGNDEADTAQDPTDRTEESAVIEPDPSGNGDEDDTEELEEDEMCPILSMVVNRFPAEDRGGRVIRYATDWDALAVSGMETPGADATRSELMRYNNLRRIEEKYNITIYRVDIPNTDLAAAVTTSQMAGAPFADMVSLGGSFAVGLIMNDQMYDVHDIAHPNSQIFTDSYLVYVAPPVLGRQVFFRNRGINSGEAFMGYNYDIIRAIGAPDPQELFFAGEWTWDAFLDIAILATQDTNNDGTIDQWGYSGVGALLAEMLIASNGGVIFEPGVTEEQITSPRVVNALNFFNRLYNIDQVVFTYNNDFWAWGENNDAWRDGSSAFYRAQAWMHPPLDSEDILPFEHRVVPFPLGPDNTDGRSNAAGVPGGWFIPRGVEDPTFVFQIFEESMEFYRYGGLTWAEYHESGQREWLSSMFLTETCVELILWLSGPENLRADWRSLLTDVNWGAIWTNIWDQTETVAQAVEAARPIIQDRMDLFYAELDEEYEE